MHARTRAHRFSYNSFDFPERWIRTDRFILQVLGGFSKDFQRSALLETCAHKIVYQRRLRLVQMRHGGEWLCRSASFVKLPVNDSTIARPDGAFRIVTKDDKMMLGVWHSSCRSKQRRLELRGSGRGYGRRLAYVCDAHHTRVH